MVPRLPVSAAAVRPGTTQFSYPRYGGTTPYPGADSPYSDADADKKLAALCRRRSSWKCAALVLLLVVLALAALVAYLLGTPRTYVAHAGRSDGRVVSALRQPSPTLAGGVA